jgi:hypothetical protein
VFTLQSLLLNANPIYFQFSTPPKLQTMYQVGYVFMIQNCHCTSRIHNIRSNLACELTVANINGSYKVAIIRLFNSEVQMCIQNILDWRHQKHSSCGSMKHQQMVGLPCLVTQYAKLHIAGWMWAVFTCV